MTTTIGVPVSPWQGLRGIDAEGAGGFRAPRGSHWHEGLDVKAKPDDAAISPIDGKIERLSYPYGNTGPHSMRSVHIKGQGRHQGIRVKLYYVNPSVVVNNRVQQGEVLGLAQNIAKYHNAEDTMENHIHMEVWLAVDPGPMLEVPCAL